VWSLVAPDLPVTLGGVLPYPCHLIHDWSRQLKVVAWGVAVLQSADSTSGLVQRSRLMERYRWLQGSRAIQPSSSLRSRMLTSAIKYVQGFSNSYA
jgi:hypothetical protein